MTPLHTALAQFDGTHTAPLVSALDLARAERAELVQLCVDADVAVAATWVVKALLEEGVVLDMAAAFETLAEQTDWAAQLHLLQCVKFAPKPAVPHAHVIEELLAAQKVLVRVWALDALVRVADIAPDLRAQAHDLVRAALNGKTASLRARARDLKVICAGW